MRFGCAEKAEGIGDVILGSASDLAAIVDCNREALISSKSTEIAKTSTAPQDTKDFRIPGEGIDDSIVGEADNRTGLIYSDSAAVISTTEKAQVRGVSISPPDSMLCEFRGTQIRVRVEQVG